MFQALGDLLDIGAIAHRGEQRDKFIAAQPRQQVLGTKLQFHAPRHLLQIEIADVMTVEIVHLLEFIKINVDQSEDARVQARFLNLGVDAFTQRETVVNVSELVELRAAQQVGVHAPGFNSQRSQARSHEERFFLCAAQRGFRLECDKERSQRVPNARRDLFVEDAQAVYRRRIFSKAGSLGDFAPAGNVVQAGGDQCGDLFDDAGEGFRSVDVFEDAAAPPLEVGLYLRAGGHRKRLPAYPAFEDPAPDDDHKHNGKQQGNDANQVAYAQQRRPCDNGKIVD